MDEDPAGVAHHRVAQIARLRIGLLGRGDGAREHRAGRGLAQVAGQHGVRAREQSEILEALDQLGDRGGRGCLAAKPAVARVVREAHGIDRPDLVAEALQGQHGGGVADMAERDRRLDRQHIHDGADLAA